MCNSLFWKYMYAKIESGFEGQVTYWKCKVVSCSTVQSLLNKLRELWQLIN